ncbi:CAP domain-containing protein [Paludisphaera soli]|uniref:CAP domain-containing protein n=1 Tax=Paludisphaera soli TaxID=2712865 RepID=UPI0013EB16E7|nr:CAP domain-containing protein [Paludisphaera soli]
MTKLQSPWILMLLFAAAPASAQEASEGPISRFVGRFRQPSHQHHHVHVQPAAPVYDYTYAQVQPAVAQEPQPEVPDATPGTESTDEVAPHAEAVATEAPPVPQDAAEVAQAEPTYEYSSGCDPYGFMHVLNRIRSSAGLHPLEYDPNLSSWAHQNNAEQCRRGLGHHVNPSGIQNCAYNYTDADSAAAGWMNSPGHRRNMLSPSATRFGIAFGPGPYWTLNAR